MNEKLDVVITKQKDIQLEATGIRKQAK